MIWRLRRGTATSDWSLRLRVFTVKLSQVNNILKLTFENMGNNYLNAVQFITATSRDYPPFFQLDLTGGSTSLTIFNNFK